MLRFDPTIMQCRSKQLLNQRLAHKLPTLNKTLGDAGIGLFGSTYVIPPLITSKTSLTEQNVCSK
jgi:hypothetical protein